MFNVGGMELLVIGVLALVVLGPDRLPGAVRQLGGAIGKVRQVSQGFQVDLKASLAQAELEADAAAAPERVPASRPPT